MNKTLILEILGKIIKSWWTIVAGITIGITIGTVALQYLPKTYEAGTTVLVIPPQIPESLMRSTVTDDMSMRLRALREAVLSRSYMEDLVKETYGTDLSEEEMDGWIRSISSRMKVSLLRIDPRQGGGVFQLAYRDQDRHRAADVVNRLTRLYIDQNIRFRTGQATGTEETFRELLSGVEEAMKEQEAIIAKYQERHLYETQEHSSANLQLLNGRQDDLASNRERKSEVQDDLDLLNIQKDQADWTVLNTAGSDRMLDPRSVQLRRLQDELKNLEAKYSDSHPDVVKKRQELAGFLGTPAPPGTPDESGGEPSAAVSPALLSQISALEKELNRLDAEEVRIRQDIATYTRRIENTPRVAQELASLNQTYDVIRTQYTNYREKLENARAAKSIEENQQGERFEIIQEAVAPYKPISPVPLMVYGASVAAGLCLCIFPLLLPMFLSPRVYSESGLKTKTDTPVLISIPRIRTPEFDHEGRNGLIRNLAWSFMSILAGAAVVVAVL
jgi:polysaccharide chain length determinant protein (PEP-CTERM system associated)